MDVPGGSHAQRVLSLLNQQRGVGRFCDAMLSIPNGQVYLAHRNVLACFSQLFQESSSTSSTPCMEVCLPEECPNDGLELLLNFFYTGELTIDSSNLEKVRHAASSLSVPEYLIPCQDFPGEKAFQTEVATSGQDEGKPVMTVLPVDSKADMPVKRKPKTRQGTKNKTDAASGMSETLSAVLDHDEVDELTTVNTTFTTSVTTSITTTTRSGRKIKGPSRLVGETPSPVVSRMGTTRRRAPMLEAKEECNSVPQGGDECSQALSENEEGGAVENRNDDNDEDGGEIEVFTEDTDEEYVPNSMPATMATSQRGPRRPSRKAVNKENGASKDKKKDTVQCPTCHKTFLSKYYLKVHNRRHTGEKPFECTKCGKCYYRKDNLQEHEARNCQSRAEVVFTCSRCSMTFRKRLELRLHMVTHTGEMPNKCTSCSEQFMQKKELRIHLIKVHGAPKPHACPLCPKCFLSRTELRLHEASKHRGEKLFVCEECGHRASSRNGLQMHIKAIHRNERPFVCEFCNHAFTQKANLNMHLRTHTGEKPFQCHLCGKTFRSQASLDKHHRTHTGERPYACEFCEQRFTEKGPLLRHVASKHQEGRPHFCTICSKTFKAIEQLRVHVQRHKGMRKFECTECGYKFTRQAHLRRHSQIHNRVENYNPRQRRLRNLVVSDEAAPDTATTSENPEGSGTVVNMVVQPTTVMVQEDVTTHGANTAKEHTTFTVTQKTVSVEQAESCVAQGTGGGEVQAELTVADVMEQTLLVTEPYQIHHSSVVVELEDAGAEEKAGGET
ncbi:telomere zinc finger-associated protein [Chanos chanos]|uniref:Telomere zinc finger-associated protein n=1 Tax=Chanos chanos TaxID=29144 RepID=A0A6J2UUX7_CHACN|nr:telomere zinc finger-associated protein [Chanos chanos]